MPAAVALTRPLPGFTTEHLAALGIDAHFLSFDENNLSQKLNILKNNIDSIDALALSVVDKCTEEALKSLSTLYPQCKLIANFGVGYNHIDIAAAASLGIRVTNTPGVLTNATADVALALLLMTTRRLFEGAHLMKSAGRFEGWTPQYMLGTGIQNKTVGIVGFGEIGKAFAKRAEVLGAKVVVLKSAWSQDIGTNRLMEDEFLATCDVISFHCKLTPQSQNWLNAERLSRCKHGVVIINTARGEIINEADLAGALQQGNVSAAGLDVFCNEPILSSALQKAPNVIVLPHLGSATAETRQAMSALVVKNILAYSSGAKMLPNEVRIPV